MTIPPWVAFGEGRSLLPYARLRSATLEHGPIPSGVRSFEFHVVISTALSVEPTKYALTWRRELVSNE